jgi:hypothetical protein
MTEKYKTKDGPAWDEHVGKEVLFMVGTEIKAIGTMLQPNLDEGYVRFCPHISFDANGKTARFDEESPKTISLRSLSSDVEYSLENKYNGYTAERVDIINRATRQKDLGFYANQEKE